MDTGTKYSRHLLNMVDTKKIGISRRISVVAFIVGLITIFLPRNTIPPPITMIGVASYVIGVLGLVVHLIIIRFDIKKDIISIPTILTICCLVFYMTLLGYNSVTDPIEEELDSGIQTGNTLVTTGTVTNKTKSKLTRHVTPGIVYVEIEYYANGQLFSSTLNADMADSSLYQINGTIGIEYSKENPNTFRVCRNHRAIQKLQNIIERSGFTKTR